MRSLFLVVLLILSGSVSMQCQSVAERASLNTTLNDLRGLKLGGVSKSEIKNKFGSPDEIEKGKWTYRKGAAPKLWFFFKNDRLTSVSWSIWEQDLESDINKLMNRVPGNWKIIKEPMSNPHSAPSQCYLEDLENGRRVEVSGYKKTATEISLWKPSKNHKSIKHYLLKKVGKEFCIASSCSKVTDPDAWEHNHCEWLEKLVVNKQGPVRNKKAKSK